MVRVIEEASLGSQPPKHKVDPNEDLLQVPLPDHTDTLLELIKVDGENQRNVGH